MIEHVWTVVCRQAVVDKESNTMSLQGVLENIEIFGEPEEGKMVPVQFDVASLWSRTGENVPSTGIVRIELLSPAGNKLLASKDIEVNLLETERHRTIVHFQGMPVSEAGRHTICVELQEEGGGVSVIASVPIMIKFSKPEGKGIEGDLLDPQID